MNTETAGHDHIRLIVKRQEGPNAKPHWEEFSVAHQPHMNVVSALMEIRKNPVNAQGKPTTPVVWESVCLEEVCGACTMIINGTPSLFGSYRRSKATHSFGATNQVPPGTRLESGQNPFV